MELSLRAPLLWLLPLCLLACDPFHTEFDPVESAQLYESNSLSNAPEAPTSLRVMTWNIKFGGGRVDYFWDCFGNRTLLGGTEVRAHLDDIASLIRAIDPDILLLQEVDTNSKRTAFIDQVQYLLNETSLNYGAYASQWRADYVPSDGLGPVDNGNAILSRWPLVDAERVAFPLRTDQSGLTRYFYLRRNFLRARLDLAGRDDLWLLNTHTDAYGNDGTKRRQIDLFHEESVRLRDEGGWLLGGGDLNTIPPGSEQAHDFPDSICEDEEYQADDYRLESDWLDPLYADFEPAISLSEYQSDNAAHFSHTVDGDGFWNRKLDYLFTSSSWREGASVTIQSVSNGGYETMPLSDHAPVVGIVELP